MTVQDYQLRIAAKNPCRIASTANLGLTGLAAIDGVTPVAGDRVLAKDQTAGEENGIYVAASGAWARALDMNNVNDDSIKAGLSTYIQEGTANAKKTFYLTTSGAIVLDTTVLVFELGPTAGAGSSIAGSTGATDNALLRADGTGGATVQASGVTLSDANNLAGLVSVSMPEQATAPVTPGAGNGAFWVNQGTGVNLPYFTDENALNVALVRSVVLSRSMPNTAADSVELGSFTSSNCQSLGIVVHTGTATSNDYVAYHRVIVRNPNSTGAFQIHQPLHTSGPLNAGIFGDLIQVEINVAVGGVVTLRARSYIGIAATVKFRLILDGDDTGVFTPSSTQATTTAPTTNFLSSMLTMTDALNSASVGTGIVAWRPFYFEERAAADTDIAGFGQLWVRNDSPNSLVFTDDTGTDNVIKAAPTQTNAVFVSKAGSDGNSGLSTTAPKLTIGSAITAASGLTPSTTNRVGIYIQDGGTYTEAVTLASYVSLFGPDATLVATTNAFALTMGIESVAHLNRIVGAGTIAGPVRINQAGKCWLKANNIEYTTGLSSASGIVLSNAGAEAYIDIGRILVEDGTALYNLAAAKCIGTIGEILINDAGWGIYMAGGEFHLAIGKIHETATATDGIDLNNSGSKAYLTVGEITLTNTYEVATGAELNLFVGSLTGTAGPIAGTANVSVAGVGILGSTGATDNTLLRADGAGGSTLQASGVSLDDSDNFAGVHSVVMDEVATPASPGAGTGRFFVKNDTPSNPAFQDDQATAVAYSLLYYSPVKRPCRLATTANVADLAAGAPDTVDGVGVAVGNRILVKNQSTGAQNGIYQVDTVGTGSNGTWTRAGDWAVGSLNHIEAGVETYIQEGTQSGTRFTLSTTGAIVVGTTAITFA